jgi:hypothetical protein
MQYRHIQGVWGPPHQTGQRAPERPGCGKEYSSATFTALSKLVDGEEYEEMLAQWRLGLREIWLEDGFVMTCLTPKQ